MNAPDRLAVFLDRVRQIGAQRDGKSWRLYEQFKGDLDRDFPGLSPEQRDAAIRAIAKAAGV